MHIASYLEPSGRLARRCLNWEKAKHMKNGGKFPRPDKVGGGLMVEVIGVRLLIAPDLI